MIIGQTYGNMFDIQSIGAYPDLQAAVGINGKEGYIKTEDMDNVYGTQLPKLPNNPDEAVIYMQQMEVIKEKAKEEGKDYLAEIPVYDLDGTTIIDTFRIGSTN